MTKPLCVCVSDIHFNINTLPLASASLRAALAKAEELNIPLVIAGDLNDSKAIIRAEVANELISILKPSKVKVYILEGNHDKVNEKGSEHGLNYLRPYAEIIDSLSFLDDLSVWLIPYQSNTEYLNDVIQTIPPQSTLIMHQGFLGAQMGDYIQDKSSIDPALFKDFTVISGHYHRHQTIGTITYIGSPYTITFGEANDGPKGFLILNEDGSFTREILELRKHIIVEMSWTTEYGFVFDHRVAEIKQNDLLWLKVTGPKSELDKLDKKELGMLLIGHNNYKLDKIVTEQDQVVNKIEGLADDAILDLIIDALPESDEQKANLKKLWREVL